MREADSPLVSVVVPTFRRPALLARCLRALAAQRIPPALAEVIVVDDGASTETKQVVAAAQRVSRIPIRCIDSGPAAGPATARNAGWRASRAEHIAFTDDDCIPSRDWLQAGIDALSAGVDGACGQVVVPIPTRPTDYERDTAGLQRAEFVTANCFYRRAALEAIGGFDPRFRIAWREDSDVYFELLERGVPLGYAPAAVVVHPVRPAPWGVSLGQQRKNVFNALLYRKHAALYRQRIQSSPPWRYYATLAVVLAGVAAAVAGVHWLAAVSGLAWLTLVLSFSAQRLKDTSHAPRHVVEMVVTSALIPLLAVFWRLNGAARFRVWFF